MSELVGRTIELAAIEAAFDRLDERGVQVIEVVGDPGIGKSHLLAELRRRVNNRGLPALAGRAGEYEQSLPYGVFVEAVDDHLARFEPSRLDPARLARCAAVFPALADVVDAEVHVERHRLHRAVRALFAELAGRRGLALILDDLHWADDASLELLDYLCRHPPECRLLIAGAYRPRQASAKLAAIMTRDSQRIALSPLAKQDVVDLVGSRRSAELYDASGGNPLYLLALAGTNPVHTSALPQQTLGIPPAVEAALLAEFDRATPEARLIAQAAAVAGDPFDFEVAAEAAGVPEHDVLQRLDDLVALDLVRPEEGARRFQFRHPLVRQIVYQSATEAFRLGAHARAAKALERQGAAVSTLAHHVERSAEPGDDLSIEVLARAADEALPKAPATAAQWLGTALRLLAHEPATASRRLELALTRARALVVSADVAHASALLDDVLSALPPEPTPQRLEALALYALVAPMLARDRARALLHRELDQLRDDDSCEAARLKLALALVETNAGAFEGRDVALEAFRTAQRHGDRLLQGESAGLLAVRNAGSGRIDAAIQWYAVACGVVDSMYDAEVASGLDVLPALAWAALLLDRYDDCLRYADRAVAIARSGGQGYVLTYLLNSRTVALRVLGKLAEAEEAAEIAADAVELSPDDGMRATVWCQQCWIALWKGDVDAAIAIGVKAVKAGNATGGQCRSLAEAGLVAARLAAGEATAIEDFLQVVGGADAPDLDVLNRTSIYGYLTAGEIDRGRLAAAEVWAAKAEATCPTGLPRRTGHALLARARVLLAGGDGSGAVDRAVRAVEEFSAAAARYEVATARLVVGQAFAVVGDRGQAVASLDDARLSASGFGARRLEAQAVRELRRLGRRVSGSAVGGGGTLTTREQQVAELVAAGLTSREIGRRLFLSPRTVETHLSNIYTKLNVSSRAALASVWARDHSRPPSAKDADQMAPPS